MNFKGNAYIIFEGIPIVCFREKITLFKTFYNQIQTRKP